MVGKLEKVLNGIKMFKQTTDSRDKDETLS